MLILCWTLPGQEDYRIRLLAVCKRTLRSINTVSGSIHSTESCLEKFRLILKFHSTTQTVGPVYQLDRTACLLDASWPDRELSVGLGGISVKFTAQWPIRFPVNVWVYEVMWQSSVFNVKGMFWLILFIWSRHISKLSGPWRITEIYHPRRETSIDAYKSFALTPPLKLAKRGKPAITWPYLLSAHRIV